MATKKKNVTKKSGTKKIPHVRIAVAKLSANAAKLSAKANKHIVGVYMDRTVGLKQTAAQQIQALINAGPITETALAAKAALIGISAGRVRSHVNYEIVTMERAKLNGKKQIVLIGDAHNGRTANIDGTQRKLGS